MIALPSYRPHPIKVKAIMDVGRLLEILKKEAECPICLETVRSPKSLPCLHSFCLLCLNNLGQSARRPLQTTINCPVCQTVVEMPEAETFDAFPTSFHLNRLVDVLALGVDGSQTRNCNSCEGKNTADWFCIDCHSLFCKHCIRVHNQMKVSSSHRNVFVQNLRVNDINELICRPVYCMEQYHEKDPLEYYCQECDLCICHKCGRLTHNQHALVDIRQAAEDQSHEIVDVVQKVKQKIVLCERKMEKGNELLREAKHEIEAARIKVAMSVEDFIRVLRQHKNGVMARLDDLSVSLQNAHATQQKNLQMFNVQLQSSVKHCEAILARNVGAEILQAKTAVVARCEDLLGKETMELHKPLHVNYVRDVQNIDHVQRSGLGQVVVSPTDSLQSVAEGEGLAEAKLGEEARFTVKTKDSDGEQFYFEGDKLTITILSPTGESLGNKTENSKDGQYTVTYKPDAIGQHEVVILINGKPLAGSPWILKVTPHHYKSIRKFGTYGKDHGQFDGPYDLAVSKTGNVAVADYRNKRIQLFSPEGLHLKTFHKRRFGTKKMGAPDSLAFTPSGDVIVLHSKILSLFGESGDLINHVATEHLKHPFSICLSPDGHFVVCDKGDNRIKVLSPDGAKLLLSFRAPDCDSPPWCAVCHQDKLFVSYAECGRVKVFNKEGKFLYNIVSRGLSDKHRNFPVGVAVDRFKNLIVCDYNNGTLQVFTEDGTFVNEVDEQINGLLAPHSVAVSCDGCIFVTEISEHSVHVFR